ncbi:ATP-binding protein [Rhodospirillales bacterium]|nr:ATP-binding protein [Rhodospirillales bacterium]
MVDLIAFIPYLMTGIAFGALVVLPFVFVYRSRAREAASDLRRAENNGRRAREILSVAPDGIFLWDHATGGISCSRRLADMLELKAGTLARYDDIRVCFEDNELQKLEHGVSLLRAKGTSFEILLNRNGTTIQAFGSRASSTDGTPIADIVWMRDISALGGQPAQPMARNTTGLEDKHLTALLDTLPIPLWLRDPDLKVAFMNRAAERVEGLDAGLAERARAGRTPIAAAAEISENGTTRTVQITETPLSNNNTGTGGTIGFAVDFPEISQPAPVPSESSSPASRANPADMLQPLEIGVVVFDANTQVIAANNAFATLWSIDPDWLDTRPSMADLLIRLRELRRLPEVADFSEFRRGELGRFGTLKYIFEDDMHLPDGRTIRRRIGPLDDGGLVMTCDDVSGNLDLKRSLKSMDRVQRTTLENLREGVVVFGADGRLQLTNPRMLDLWDLTTDDLVQDLRLPDVIQALGMRMAADNEPWQDRKTRIAAEILDRQASTGRVELINGHMLAFANLPLPDGATLVSYADITDSFRVEEALRERARTLAEADRMKTEFIAKVADEVRTPLSTINGFAEILGKEMFGELNSRQREYAEGILETSNRMSDVVADIFDLATIEAGRMTLNKDTVDGHSILLDAFNAVAKRAEQKNLQMKFDCPPDIGWLSADEKRLKQVFSNLLNNAVTFTPKLGTVTLSAERTDDGVTILVSDSGPGIPKSERDRVFEPFARAGHETRGGDGPGLGLTIVRKFIDLHGGTVEIRSNQSRGTTVVCTLPDDGNDIRVASQPGGHANLTDKAAE